MDERPLPRRPEPGRHHRADLFIDGTWVAATGRDRTPVVDCATGGELGTIASASQADLDGAVAAATRAFSAWSGQPVTERAGLLGRLADELRARATEIAALISAEVGTATRLCPAIQVSSAISVLEAFAEDLTAGGFGEVIGNATVVQEPVGVVAAITPWNFPLYQAAAKIGAALAAGCTVVHKPSTVAPLSAFALADAVHAAGLPAGVYNLIAGAGGTVGTSLATHRGVDMVSFTGSTEAGVAIYRGAADGMKRVALELGGKSASVVLPDADLHAAVRTSVNRAFLNAGQTCDAWTRLVVPRDRLDQITELAVAAADRLAVGDPFDPATRLGPLVSPAAVERVRNMIRQAMADGAAIACGGPWPVDGLSPDRYVPPTVLVGVTPDMTVAREEVFGPVLAILTYADEEDAIAIANDTDYGLAAAVWTADDAAATRVAGRLRAGQVVVNGGAFNPRAPFGGMRMSGIGRELGRAGILEFTESKTILR